MASARDIRRRIKSVKKTQQITKAMKMVAAAKLRRAQEAAIAARPYAVKLTEVLGRVANAAGDVSHPLLEVRDEKKVAYIVITADRGLCGGFNSNTIRYAVRELKNIDNPSIIAVGRKARDYFKRLDNVQMAASYVGLGEYVHFGQAQEIAKFVIEKYTEGEFDSVYLVFSEFINTLTQRPTKQKLLPVEPPEQKQEKGVSATYTFEPSAEIVLSELLPKYIEVSLYRAILESKAGEQGARMTAMDSATSNAKEMIDKLTLSFNRARQAAITKELAEIVGGAAALE
ncbi:ATP synthase F1 subunit gamma [Peptococcaceae bacterium]|nr:ATP synthase F1 subunit gamma [Peptococcaceae bacterium]MCL0043493.1 ATP synthase F1 subunit gamma [Peptococcaceae bacterium]MCL0071819.1 ATP synthase F1 subunit gamma [Peptococcaceae bacterium]